MPSELKQRAHQNSVKETDFKNEFELTWGESLVYGQGTAVQQGQGLSLEIFQSANSVCWLTSTMCFHD